MGKGMPLYGLHKSGREFPVEVGLTPIETFQGKMTLCTVVDVTERKKAEEDLLAANREMEAFTYMVSHDLRAPVRTMAGFARILMEDFGPALEPEAQRHVRTIQKGAQRMGELIDDLLEFSRVGRSALECRPVNMTKLVEEVWEDLKSQRDGRNIELEAADLPRCLGDRRLLALVWMNLLANAVKYTGPREQARIEVGWRPDEERPEWVTIRVTDNGVGFDQQYVDKLFRVFQRLHREDEFEGTGVGLAIVHRIVTRHGGRVWAEGRLGEGATVYFTLEKAA
jgi:light-regulated signal transduction histidine kinase (bacteriophytochrome)